MRLACLVAIAAVLRLGGISFGLPYIFGFDEPTSIGEAIHLIHGAPDALSFANPPLFKYLLVGLFSAIVGTPRLDDVDPTLLYFIARSTSAILGSATVLVVYWIARQLRDHQTGMIAAGLTAVTYLLVRESHFAVNDALAGLAPRSRSQAASAWRVAEAAAITLLPALLWAWPSRPSIRPRRCWLRWCWRTCSVAVADATPTCLWDSASPL